MNTVGGKAIQLTPFKRFIPRKGVSGSQPLQSVTEEKAVNHDHFNRFDAQHFADLNFGMTTLGTSNKICQRYRKELSKRPLNDSGHREMRLVHLEEEIVKEARLIALSTVKSSLENYTSNKWWEV